MRLQNVLLVGTAALMLTACVSTNSTMLGQAVGGTAVAPESVVIYRTASQVPSNYRELAILNSKGDSNFTNERKMYESMRKEAARIGANAIILDALSEPSPAVRVAAAIFGVGVARKGSAVAIYVEPKAPPAQ